MKFSISALILLTLIIALLANVWMQRQRIARARTAIEELTRDIKLLNVDEAYLNSHTRVCELAIENNPLPSPYYLAAKQRLNEQTASAQENDQ